MVTESRRIVPIDLKDAPRAPSYDIVIGGGVLAETGKLVAERLGQRRCMIVTDGNVAPLYQQKLEDALTSAGHKLFPTIVVPAGEASKSYEGLHNLLDRVLAAGVDRKTLLLALGGGVIGDLAGVVASLAMRGIDFVQVPTTLLAQVDSSVGGKTGINTAAGKNTVGAFYQPRLVVADTDVLSSLPKRELLAGYAEVVKYGLIKDAKFFDWCRVHGKKLLDGDSAARIEAVRVSCEHKARIVAADEREAGERALLNLGHTFGHALETVTGYGDTLLHGEAVAIGTVLAYRLSKQLGHSTATDVESVIDHFHSVGLPVDPPKFAYDIDKLMLLMAQDKKAEGGKLTLILARGIGNAFVARDVDPAPVRAIWQETIKT